MSISRRGRAAALFFNSAVTLHKLVHPLAGGTRPLLPSSHSLTSPHRVCSDSTPPPECASISHCSSPIGRQSRACRAIAMVRQTTLSCSTYSTRNFMAYWINMILWLWIYIQVSMKRVSAHYWQTLSVEKKNFYRSNGLNSLSWKSSYGIALA